MTGFSDPIVAVYEELVDKLLINAARHCNVGGEIKESFNYAARKLAELGAVRKESAKIIAGMISKNPGMIEEAVKRSMLAALKECEPELARAASVGLIAGTDVPMREGITEALAAYSKQAADQMNLVNTVMLDSTIDAYQDCVQQIQRKFVVAQKALNTEAGAVITGVSSTGTAVRDAVRKMNEAGLTGFVDHGGHRWSPEAYARMDIETTCHNAARQAVFDRNEAYGNDLVSVRINATARPKCYPYEGKVISLKNNRRTVQDVSGNNVEVIGIDDTTYGEPDGLWGINCHHTPPNVFIPGASAIRGEEYKPDEQENERRYKLTQQEKKLQREIRDARREAQMMQAAGSEEGRREALEKLKKKTQEYTQFRANNPELYNDDWAKPINPKKPAAAAPAHYTIKELDDKGVEYISFGRTDRTSQDQIVKDLAGADRTDGSCASLATAYIGRRNGYDILDFRGGESLDYFAYKSNRVKILDDCGIPYQTFWDFKGACPNAKAALRSMIPDKEYCLAAGGHCAIVRKTSYGMYEYFELQSGWNNGWQNFSLNLSDTLNSRFGCSGARTSAVIFDIENAAGKDKFFESMGYINTRPEDQQKGSGGGIK